MSGLSNLPPVMQFWDDKVFDDLTEDEMKQLQLMLRLKIDAVTDRYERKLFWQDRERFMQLKMLAYGDKPKRDYLF
jgi:hypothetical protein